jgi:GntR family transcriptional regulator
MGAAMPEPMYQQIAEDLRRRIESGELGPGSQLPTEIELREQYHASRNTVRDAIKWLMIRGLVETRPGQGTFVIEKIKPFVTPLTGDPRLSEGEGYIYRAEVEASGRRPDASEPRVEIQRAGRVIAGALRIDEGSQVVSRHQQRFIDDTPFSLQTSFYPMRLVERGATKLLQATNIQEGTIAYLSETLNIHQVGYRDTISVRPPDENEIAFFKLPADGRVQVFEVHRVAFDDNGDRIRLTITVYPADRNRFLVTEGAVPARGQPASGHMPSVPAAQTG